MIDRRQAEAAFYAYTSHYDPDNSMIRHKIEHTLRVAGNCERIAVSLRVDDDDAAFVRAGLHTVHEIPVLREGQAANAVCLDDNGFVMIRDVVQHARIHPGNQLEQEDFRHHLVVELKRCHGGLRNNVPQDAAAVDRRDFRIVDARKRIVTLGSCLAGAGADDRAAGEYQEHTAHTVFAGEADAVEQVFLRVGDFIHQRLLRTGQHDRLVRILDEVGKRR